MGKWKIQRIYSRHLLVKIKSKSTTVTDMNYMQYNILTSWYKKYVRLYIGTFLYVIKRIKNLGIFSKSSLQHYICE